jgi:hypothetical protein
VRSPPGRIALALSACVGLAASRAGAAPLSAELTVARAAGADDCPDEVILARIIERIVSPDASGPLVRPGGDVRAAVSFARGASTYEATLLLTGKREGRRTLTDTGATCTALGRAVGITMALLLDAGLETRADPPPSAREATPATPPPDAADAADAAVAAAPRATDGLMELTLGPALGLVGGASIATGLAFVVGWRHRASLALDGQYVAPRSTSFDTGDVDVTLLAARLRACAVLSGDAPTRLGLCAAGAAGRLRGEGHGYATADGRGSLTWLAAGGGLEVSHALGRRWRVGVMADVLAPLRKSTFSIMNRGVGYQSSAVSAMLALGVGVAIW